MGCITSRFGTQTLNILKSGFKISPIYTTNGPTWPRLEPEIAQHWPNIPPKRPNIGPRRPRKNPQHQRILLKVFSPKKKDVHGTLHSPTNDPTWAQFRPQFAEIGPTLAQHSPQSAQHGPDMTQKRRVHLSFSAKAQMNTPFSAQHRLNKRSRWFPESQTWCLRSSKVSSKVFF